MLGLFLLVWTVSWGPSDIESFDFLQMLLQAFTVLWKQFLNSLLFFLVLDGHFLSLLFYYDKASLVFLENLLTLTNLI